MKIQCLILVSIIVIAVCPPPPHRSHQSMPQIKPIQQLNTFSLLAVLNTNDNSQLKYQRLYNSAFATIFYSQPQRKLVSIDLPILTILNIVLLPSNVVKFIFQNPPIDIDNALIVIQINNPNINQTILEFEIPKLYSRDTINSIVGPMTNTTSQVLLSILLFVMLIFYVLGYKNNHTISFIQKISFLRFNLPIVPTTYSFLYSLKYSYYAYGKNALQSVISPNYLENSNGNFFFERDANILRNVGIPIVISMALFVLRIVGLVIFRKKDNQVSTQNDKIPSKKLTFEKGYYRAVQYFEKTIMFPIMFFSIAEITFANLYGKSLTVKLQIYNTSLAFSILYIFYFAIVTTLTLIFNQKASKYTKLELIGEYLLGLLDSIIIIHTSYTRNILTLIITIIAKCGYRLFLKYFFARISKFDIISLVVMSFQISLIIILSNRYTSLISIQALFVVIVVLDLIYASIETSLKLLQQKIQKQKQILDQHEASADIIKGTPEKIVEKNLIANTPNNLADFKLENNGTPNMAELNSS